VQLKGSSFVQLTGDIGLLHIALWILLEIFTVSVSIWCWYVHYCKRTLVFQLCRWFYQMLSVTAAVV